MHQFNLAVLVGTLSSEPRQRDLPSGTRLLTLEVTTQMADQSAASVPVAYFDPPVTVSALHEGALVAVVGHVRRRFFRAGGATVSRTEVVAARVVPAGRKKTVEKLLADAEASLAQVAEAS